MESYNRFYIFTLLFIVIIIDAVATNDNETSLTDSREPRLIGRPYLDSVREPILCTGEGFQPDNHDCSIFYRCMKSGNGKYTVFRFKCGPATIYDPETEVCNYPQSTKRSECGGLRAPSADRNDVNEIDEGQQEIPSPISTKLPIYNEQITHENNFEMQTKLPELSTVTTVKTGLSTGISSATSSISDAYPFMTSMVHQKPQYFETSKPTDLPSKASSTKKSESQSDENLCTTDGFIGDSQNCRKFYRCVANQRNGYTRYEFSCSESTIWDDDIQGCNHEWAVKRTRCARNNDILKENIVLQQNLVAEKPAQQQISDGSKVTQTQFSNGSMMQNQMPIKFGDRINQNEVSNSKQNKNQTQISNSLAVSQNQTQIDNGATDAERVQTQIDHSKQSSQVYASITQGTTFLYATSEKTSKNNICVQSGFMGDSNDCKKFYRCVDNGKGGYTKFEFSCGEGTVWDQGLEACNHAWAVKECGGTSPSEATMQTAYTSAPEVYTSTHKLSQNDHTIKPVESSTSHIDSTNNEDIGYGNQNQHTPLSTTAINEKSTTEALSNEDTGYGNNYHQHSTVSTSTETQTNVSSGLGAECNSSGFMGDANNCRIFYRCVENGKGFTKYEFKCGEGTVWDASIEACNHAWAVNNCGSSASTDILKVEETTTKHTTPTTAVMQNITVITTTMKPLPTKDENHDAGYGPQIIDFSSSTSTSTTKQPQNLVNNIGNVCKSSGFMGDEKDCKKFYRCVDNSDGSFIRYEFSCGEGTVWDPEIEACNHAWAVKKCGGGGSGSEPPHTIAPHPSSTITIQNGSSSTENYILNTTTTYTYSTISSTTTSTQATLVTDSNICTRSGFIGDNEDCKKFYRCVDNGNGYTRFEFSCVEGTVWDSKIEACNHAWAVEKCGGSVGSTNDYQVSTPSYQESNNDTTNESNPSAQQAQGSESSTTPQSIIIQSTTEAIKTDSETSICKSSGFFGDKSDCKKFYRCVDDGKGAYIRYEFNCGEGTLWDQTIEACNHAWAVNNCGKSGSNTTQTTTVVSTSPQLEYTSSESDDQGYGQHTEATIISPISTTLQLVTTQIELSTSTSSSNTEAQYSTEKVESTSSTSGAQCTSEGFFAHPHDCKKFIRCVSNNKDGYTKYEFSCGEGTVWVQEILACDHDSDDLNCKHQSQSTTGPQITEEEHTDNISVTTVTPALEPQPIGGEHSSSISESIGTSTSKPQTTDKLEDKNDTGTDNKPTDSIKCTAEGFFGNKKNCKQFYRCVNNGQGGYTKYDYTCGEGTAWDSEIQTCNHIDLVKTCNDQTQEATQPIAHNEGNGQTTDIVSITSTSKSTPLSGSSQETSTASSGSSQGTSTVLSESSQETSIASSEPSQETSTSSILSTSKSTPSPGSSQETTTASSVSSQGTSTPSSGPSQETSSASIVSSQETSTAPSGSSQGMESKDKCTEEGFFGNSRDCTKFYRCVDNGKGGYTKYDFTCGDGTIWDSDVTTCNYPQNVANPSCSQSQDSSNTATTTSSSLSPSTSTQSTMTSKSTSQSLSPSTSTQSTTTSKSTSQSTAKSTTLSTSNCSQEESAKDPVKDKGVNCTKGGYYPNPNDCKKFYRCVDWNGDGTKFSVYHFECGEGTIWDPAIETCNHEDSVYPPRDCSGAQSIENGNQTTTTDRTTTDKEETTISQGTTISQSNTEQTSTQSSEQTTQQSTTEQTTTLSTTSEQTTTPHSTTSEQTTTQQSSTTEQTTTQQSTTSEPTTAQQSTTSDQTTTTQSITSEPTTTQQSTSSEQTTTQQFTTEETTTHQSTTPEATTTQQPTTSEQTTTQKSTTEATTTQQSTSSEQSTQASATTEQTTTPQSTTTQQSPTVESSTTELSTSSSTTETAERPTTYSSTTAGEPEPTEGTPSQKECPETDDDQYMLVCPTSFRRHPKYCNMFYQCTDDDPHDVKIATFTCPNSTIYDENQTKCVEESKAAKKCNGEIALRRIERLGKEYKDPIIVTEQSYACTSPGYFTFEKDSECSPAFLKCKTHKSKLRGYVHQCPDGYYFWYKSRRCEQINKISDCKRSNNDWSGRWEIPIEIKNVAS